MMWLALAVLQDPLPFGDNYAEALKQAKEMGRPVLVLIHEKECPYCRKMEKEAFSDPEVKAQCLSSFVNVAIVWTAHRDLVKRFKAPVTPSSVLVDGDGEVISAKFGYFPTASYRRWVKACAAAVPKLADLREKLKQAPKDVGLLFAAGNEQLSMGMDERAIAEYAKALEHAGTDLKLKARILYAKGLAHYRKQDGAEPLADTAKEIKALDPDGKLGVLDRGLVFEALYGCTGVPEVDVPGAIERAMTSFPNSEVMDGLLFVRGHIEWQAQQDIPKAIETFQHVVDKYPDSFFREWCEKLVGELGRKR